MSEEGQFRLALELSGRELLADNDEKAELQEALRLSLMPNESPAQSVPAAIVQSDARPMARMTTNIGGPQAIAVSLTTSNTSSKHLTTAHGIKDQLRQRNERTKRKAPDDDRPDMSKKHIVTPAAATATATVVGHSHGSLSTSSFSGNARSIATPVNRRTPQGFTFSEGSLRITRTPGRSRTRNTISLADLIDPTTLTSACVFSFFIGQDELFDHFPFAQNSAGPQDFVCSGSCAFSRSGLVRDVPIYVGRDANQDHNLPLAIKRARMQPKNAKLSQKELESLRPHLEQLYREHYGANYRAFYPFTAGCAHSKILALVYPQFLRIVITSANLMDIDTVLGDNHWFIQDLPRLTKKKRVSSDFEDAFLDHLSQLSCPDSFVEETLRGHFDFSKVKVQLVTSKSGTHSKDNAERYGLLRLHRVIVDLNLKLSKSNTMLEYCAGSIGALKVQWLNDFYRCAIGQKSITVEDESTAIPPLTIVFPTPGDVRSCHEDSQVGASNVGCHLVWNDPASKVIKPLFHHYVSKDIGRLFHMKLLMALDKKDPAAVPRWIYIGSANFSKSAWGSVIVDRQRNASSTGMKLVDTQNLECGVIIPGDVLPSLLEDGIEWQDGVVPYVRPAAPYNLMAGEKAWNDPVWVQHKFG